MTDDTKLVLKSYVLLSDPQLRLGLVGPFTGTDADPNEDAMRWALSWQARTGSMAWEILVDANPQVLSQYLEQPLAKPRRKDYDDDLEILRRAGATSDRG